MTVTINRYFLFCILEALVEVGPPTNDVLRDYRYELVVPERPVVVICQDSNERAMLK